MSRPPSLDGRAVSWTEVVDNFDGKTLMKKGFSGTLLSHAWHNGVCRCIVVDRSGVLHNKNATDLIASHAPDSLPNPKFSQ